MIGHQIGGRYRIIQRLGGGGMGVVYQAEDMLLGRDVAIKVLRAHLAEDDAFRRRFQREGRSAAGLSHPNIVQVYDVGETPEGVPYMVMEYVEGPTLDKVLRQNGPLPEARAVEVAIQVASALAEAHRRGVVHRDVKPLNILVRPDGTVKVADFGIARASTGATLVNTGTIVGSAHYVSPEQARGGYVDEKTDVYSLGIVLYEMLTGRTPFQGDTAVAVALKHLQDEVPAPSGLAAVSRRLEAVVLRALEKDPGRRYPSANALLADLEAVRTQGESGRAGVRRRVRGGGGAQSVWVAVVAALIVAAVGAAAYAYTHYIEPKPLAVPAVRGEPAATAAQAIVGAGLRAHTADVSSLTVPAGDVVSTKPAGGSPVKAKALVTVNVSVGPPSVAGGVPNVAGQELSAAQQELEGLGLKVAQVLHRPSNVYGKGEVSSTEPPAGTPIRQGQPVSVTVSTGTSLATVAMPRLLGLDLATWQAALAAKGLTATEIRYGLSSLPAGQVLDQQPAPGTPVGAGSNIVLDLSPGAGGRALLGTQTTQQQSATITLPQNMKAGTPVMIQVVSGPAGATKDVVKVLPAAQPGQSVTVTYTWQGSGSLEVWIGGSVARTISLPIAASAAGG